MHSKPEVFDTPIGSFRAIPGEVQRWSLEFKGKFVRSFDTLEQLQAAVAAQKSGCEVWDSTKLEELKKRRDFDAGHHLYWIREDYSR